MSLKIIDRNIRSITTNVTKLNGLIHDTAVLIMAHAQQHGDASRAVVLVQAMPKSYRASMLVDWFTRNSPIRFNVTTGKHGLLKSDARGYVPFDLDAARAMPFYVEPNKADNDEPSEPSYLIADFDKAFARLLAKAQSELDNGNVNPASVDGITKRLAVLSAMVRTNEATKASVEFVVPTPAAVADINPRKRAAA